MTEKYCGLCYPRLPESSARCSLHVEIELKDAEIAALKAHPTGQQEAALREALEKIKSTLDGDGKRPLEQMELSERIIYGWCFKAL